MEVGWSYRSVIPEYRISEILDCQSCSSLPCCPSMLISRRGIINATLPATRWRSLTVSNVPRPPCRRCRSAVLAAAGREIASHHAASSASRPAAASSARPGDADVSTSSTSPASSTSPRRVKRKSASSVQTTASQPSSSPQACVVFQGFLLIITHAIPPQPPMPCCRAAACPLAQQSTHSLATHPEPCPPHAGHP